MTVKGQKNNYIIKVLRGYGVSIALKNNKVCLRNGTDIFTGEAEKEEWFVTQIRYERIMISGKGYISSVYYLLESLNTCPKLWLDIKSKIIGIVSAAVGVVITAGLGLYSFAGFSPQMTNNIPLPNGISTPTLDNVDTNATLGNSNPDESVVNALMVEEGLDKETATVISQIDTQVKSYDGNYLNYQQTLSDQIAWDVQIKAIPDQTYLPTEAELEIAAITGREIYDVSSSFEEIDGVPQFTLRYFVPYEAMSEELKASIQSNAGLSASAAAVGFLPSAEASGGAAGAVFETIIKSLVKEGAGKLGLSKVFGPLDAAIGAYKLSQSKSYFSELDQLRACAENPTNPLTKKTYQENPSEKAKVIDQINEAQSQVEQLTAARLLNLVAKTGAKFTGVNFAGQLFFDSVAKWSDETLKEVAEGWIDDARKGVVECEKAAIRLNGSIQYSVSKSFEGCTGGDEHCYETKEQRSGSGTFFLTTSGSVIIGNGTGTFDQTRTRVITKQPSDPLTEYDGEYDFVVSGDVQIVVEGVQSPTVRFTVNGAALLTEDGTATRYVLNYGDSKVTAVQDQIHHDITGGFLCHFEDVDLAKGGKYEEVITEGDADVGSCEMELFPG